MIIVSEYQNYKPKTRQTRVLKTLGGLVFGLGFVCLTVKTLQWNMDLPVVNYSYTNGKCVSVYNPANINYNCHNLPAKYTKQWVK